MSQPSLKDIIKIYKETFHTNDDNAIALLAAIFVGSKLDTPPVWLYLIGPSSGGKSALIEAFAKVKFCTQVSDLTPNTFLSGASTAGGRETSLLKKLGDKFVITMKDFTTILEKNDEAQAAIISQMREIYDGHISKETGTGHRVSWGEPVRGKATFIMAATEGIYSAQEKFADMGTRAINYVLLPQDREESTKRALRNNSRLNKNMDHIQDKFSEFVEHYISNIPDELPYITEEIEQNIIDVADFAAYGRSAVKRDYKGAKTLVLSAEMPMRMAKQLLAVAQLLTYINDGVLTKEMEEAVYKIALDSIPKQRRLALTVLAKYRRVDIPSAADYLNFPPERAREWIEDLNSFGMVDRIKSGEKQYWKIKDKYRRVMLKHMKIEPVDEDLEGVTGEDSGYTPTYMGSSYAADISYEHEEKLSNDEKKADALFDSIKTDGTPTAPELGNF